MNQATKLFMLTAAISTAALLTACGAPGKIPTAYASAETQPVTSPEDAADDPAIWVNTRDPQKSLILGTDKKNGLAVYNLSGELLQFLPVGKVNNVDIREVYWENSAGVPTVVVAASDRNGGIRVFKIDRTTLKVIEIAGSPIATRATEPYGFCLYTTKSGLLDAFLTTEEGAIEHYLLTLNLAGEVEGQYLRTIKVSSQAEGLVADDFYKTLYIAEEDVGVWRTTAECPTPPDAPYSGTLIDTTTKAARKGRIAADAEGLAIVKYDDGSGYLIVSNQGNNTFTVYERKPPNAFVGRFQIGDTASIDGVQETDGIDVTAASMGPLFPDGVFVAQDGQNPGANQNFKLVPWSELKKALGIRR